MILNSKYIILLIKFIIVYILILTLYFMSKAYSDNEEFVNIDANQIFISDNGNIINAEGDIVITTDELKSVSDELTYDKINDEIKSSGNIILKDKLNNYYYFNEFITDKNFDTALGSDVKIRMNDGVRIVGKSFSRRNSKINQINDASYTPCLKQNYITKNCPGWKLNAKKVIHDVESKTIYYENATLNILNVPILFTPFFSHPDPSVSKRSGLLMPSITSDNVLGTTLSLPIFYNYASNFDMTLTPTFQTKIDNYYSLNLRHMTKNHSINVDTSITDNESKTGTKNHIFVNGSIKNPFGKFDYKIETSNNDTYLRKNQINFLTVLTSGLHFTKEMDNSHLDFSSYAYKHLNNKSNQKWEYVYPTVNYDLYEFKDPVIKQNWKISNTFLNYRDINKNYNQQISSEFLSKNTHISKKIGLKYENTIQNRFIYFNNNNFNQLRIFPQIATKISYPLSKNDNYKTQLLEPILMPILSPYNNYTSSQNITNSNIFSLNRETSLSQWESGPRINYGLNWLINYETFTISSTIGQSAKINKNRENTSDEISNYFIGNTIDLGDIGYIKTDITIDRKDLYLKDNNINTSINFGIYKFGFDYDYETSNKIKTSEQLSVGTKINIIKDVDLIASIRKNLMSEKSIGNAFGVHYENDCLAINFDYFRDFTAVDDIKNSRGFSFTITLKPFGSSKQSGKTRNFGPQL